MWSDNETERDFLNFSGVADTVAAIIVQADGRATSIGVSGSWGSGKSSMIKLVRRSLAERTEAAASQFVFVEFNAWLYQGYDDARAALLEEIATKLAEEASARETGMEKAQNLLKRVNWLRAAKLGTGSALALALGLPLTGLTACMPRDRVLTESDGPFAQVEERPLMPWDVSIAERELANLWGQTEDETAVQMYTNFKRLVS